MVDMSNTRNASVDVVEEQTAEGKVAEIYEEIKATLGIDFVPNMYKALAVNTDYLEMTWRRSSRLWAKRATWVVTQRTSSR